MEIREFESFESAMTAIAEGIKQANANLAPEQKAIDWGDYWVRFEPQEQLIILGYTFTLQENIDSERNAGADEDEIEYMRDRLMESHDDGLLFGRAYSVIVPDGELGSTHRFSMWPIDKQSFDNMQAVGWDPAQLPVDQRGPLMEAYSNLRDHMLSLL